MKKFLIIAIVLIIAAPLAAHAFSFVDVLSFGKKAIKQEVQPPPAEVKKEKAVSPARLFNLSAETKLKNWQKAFEKSDINSAIADNRNLYFTDKEINFLISAQLAAMSNPPVRDISISFSDNSAKISGYAMLKKITGNFYLEAKPAIKNNRVSFQVTKAKFNNFYFPSMLAQALLAGQLKTAIDFLYSDPKQQSLSLTLGNGFIELNYGK